MQVKKTLRDAQSYLEQADRLLEQIRSHYNFEWGEHGHCRLDTELRHMISEIDDASRSITKLLVRFAGQRIPKEW